MLSEEDIKQIRAFIRQYLKAIYCFTDSKFEDIGAFSDGRYLEIVGDIDANFSIKLSESGLCKYLSFGTTIPYDWRALKVWGRSQTVNFPETLLKIEEIFIDEFKKAKNNREKLLLVTSLPIFEISIDFITKYLLKFPY